MRSHCTRLIDHLILKSDEKSALFALRLFLRYPQESLPLSPFIVLCSSLGQVYSPILSCCYRPEVEVSIQWPD
jgi:hypothetical protein